MDIFYKFEMHTLAFYRTETIYFSAHFTMNDELPNRLSCGTVRIRSNIRCFTHNADIFDDGTIADNVDHVSIVHLMN